MCVHAQVQACVYTACIKEQVTGGSRRIFAGLRKISMSAYTVVHSSYTLVMDSLEMNVCINKVMHCCIYMYQMITAVPICMCSWHNTFYHNLQRWTKTNKQFNFQIKKKHCWNSSICCQLPANTHNRHMWADDVLNRELHLEGTLSKRVLRFLPLWIWVYGFMGLFYIIILRPLYSAAGYWQQCYFSFAYRENRLLVYGYYQWHIW